MSNQRYAKNAQYEDQTRIIDLVPESWVAISLLFVAGLLVIGGLEYLYQWMPKIAHATTDGRIASFDLDGEGSLGACFSSFQLLLAATLSLVIFHMRKQRLDDYHGRYRIWVWAAGCWAVMALDESGSLHEGFKELMVYLTGYRIYGDGSVWWVAAYGLVLGVVGLRVFIDMLEYPVSAVTLTLAGIVMVVAVVAQLDLIMPETGAKGVMVEEGLEMLGNQLLLLALAMHARFLVRDIKGLNPVWDEEEETDSEDKPRRRSRSSRTSKADAKTDAKETAAEAAESEEEKSEAPAPSRKQILTAPPKPTVTAEKAETKADAKTKSADKADEEEAPAEKSGGFFSRLFGGRRKDDESEQDSDTASDSSPKKSRATEKPAASRRNEQSRSTSASANSGNSSSAGKSQRTDDAEVHRPMSKAERKAARKQKRLERRS